MKNAKKNEEVKQELKSTNAYVRGVIVDVMYGKRSFKKGGDKEDKFRISIKAEAADMEKLVEIAGPYYEEVEDKWIPKWFTDEDAREYLNVASNYDIPCGQRGADGTIEELGKLQEYVNTNGNINGTKCVLMLTIKEGAIYPGSILLKDIQHKSISDMFAGFDEDELPFA